MSFPAKNELAQNRLTFHPTANQTGCAMRFCEAPPDCTTTLAFVEPSSTSRRRDTQTCFIKIENSGRWNVILLKRVRNLEAKTMLDGMILILCRLNIKSLLLSNLARETGALEELANPSDAETNVVSVELDHALEDVPETL